MKPLPTAEYLRERLDYNAMTGQLFWRAKIGEDRRTRGWNTRYAGKPAGSIIPRADGRTMVSLDGAYYMAYRLIWVWAFGREPRDEIDHINRNPLDNRLSNLREATRAENNYNRGLNLNNQSGARNVWRSRCGHFEAFARIDGKKVHLGTYKELAQAATVAEVYRRSIGGQFAS